MLKGFGIIIGVLVSLSLILFPGFCSNGYAETISGRLVSTLDSNSGEATVLFAGYCQDKPVIIGPYTKKISTHDFAHCTKENIATELLGDDTVVKKVSKFNNNGKEIMAEILLER
jgi:hypothetical protein